MKYTTERVWPDELEPYLNGAALRRPLWHDFGRTFGVDLWGEPSRRGSEHYGSRFFSRPASARLVAVHQEDVSNGGGYVNDKTTHEEYVVIWEHP